MHRIDGPLAQVALPASAPVGTPGYFFNGNPRRGIEATQVDDDWLNAIQEEIAHVIEWAELVLDKSRHDQLRLAIELLIRRYQPELPFLPLAGGTMLGPIIQHIWPVLDPELTHKAYVDTRDNAVLAHSDYNDQHFHNEAVQYANARAIQEGDRAQNNAWTWDQQLWERVNWVDATQGGMAVYGSDALFTAPGAARVLDVTTTAGGGGGGGNAAHYRSAGGGGAGGSARHVFAVAPGQQFWVSVGGGGAGGAPGLAGGAGAASQFGDVLGAAGGAGGLGSQTPGGAPGGGAGGVGFGAGLLLAGGDGGDGWREAAGNAGMGGHGGASLWGGGGRAAVAAGGIGGYPGRAVGAGGGGCYIEAGWGGAGAAGVVLVRWTR